MSSAPTKPIDGMFSDDDLIGPTQTSGDRARFRHLVERWKRDTEFCSSTTQMSLHPAYQQIIGMGRAALPLILDEMQREPDHWFWALSAITGENPVPSASQGHIDQMAESWLQWGRERGWL